MSWYWSSSNHVSGSGSTYNSTWGEESYLLAQFQKMKTKFVDKGYPIIVGEYGCQWRDVASQSGASQAKHDASVKAFHKEVNEKAINCGMIPMVWDINYANRQGTKGVMTLVNRSSLSIFCQPAMDGIAEGVAAATWGGPTTDVVRVPFRPTPDVRSRQLYNLSGQRVSSGVRGIVVSNGMKYLQK